MNIVFSIVFILLFCSVLTGFYLVFTHGRKQSQTLIQQELDAGKTLKFKTSIGGTVGGIRYKGPLLVLAFFDDCFIIKDKKIAFSDIKSISHSFFAGIKIDTHSGQVVEMHDDGSLLVHFPEALRPENS